MGMLRRATVVVWKLSMPELRYVTPGKDQDNCRKPILSKSTEYIKIMRTAEKNGH